MESDKERHGELAEGLVTVVRRALRGGDGPLPRWVRDTLAANGWSADDPGRAATLAGMLARSLVDRHDPARSTRETVVEEPRAAGVS